VSSQIDRARHFPQRRERLLCPARENSGHREETTVIGSLPKLVFKSLT
jgi:hypothetical protein